ncbi:MAG: hypothetical protein FWB98_08830 [Defluviitaleaceae bacterium]|nr:hypothetical protein [Defluviitaleaceae bacterium]
MSRNNYLKNQSPYYTLDSSARQISREEDFRPTPKHVKVTRKKVKAQFSEDIQVRHLHSFGYYVILLAFIGCVAGVFAVNIRLQSSQVQQEVAISRLTELTASNIARESEIHANLDWSAIEYIAINQLGMMPPEDFQRRAVAVAPQVSMMATEITEETTSSFSFAEFWRTITGNN